MCLIQQASRQLQKNTLLGLNPEQSKRWSFIWNHETKLTRIKFYIWKNCPDLLIDLSDKLVSCASLKETRLTDFLLQFILMSRPVYDIKHLFLCEHAVSLNLSPKHTDTFKGYVSSQILASLQKIRSQSLFNQKGDLFHLFWYQTLIWTQRPVLSYSLKVMTSCHSCHTK